MGARWLCIGQGEDIPPHIINPKYPFTLLSSAFIYIYIYIYQSSYHFIELQTFLSYFALLIQSFVAES